MKSLYSYFGLLDLHTIDSPGHSLYQLGLLDSIAKTYNEEAFDFYSYYPEECTSQYKGSEISYPDTDLGTVFTKYQTSLIYHYLPALDSVLDQIRNRQYSRLYLKARFRNLSTLTKKWKDALAFERIIETAIEAGYPPDRIIILDTDLSLQKSFYEKYGTHVMIIIPSIDFPAISEDFLLDCVAVHKKNFLLKKKNSVFYGNIDTSNYKVGNSKSSILTPVLNFLNSFYSDQTNNSHLYLICKESDFRTCELSNANLVLRNDRSSIWNVLSESLIMINVTKEKYNDSRFIPARIYEALIFGMIPVSFKFNFLSETFSFTTEEDLSEIVKYLTECDHEDLLKAYLHFVYQYIAFNNTLKIKKTLT